MDHHNGGGATASYSGLLDRYYRGRRSTSMYIPRFATSAKKARQVLRGYGLRCSTRAAAPGACLGSAGLSVADFKNEITRPGHWSIYTVRLWRDVADHENKVWAVVRQARQVRPAAAKNISDEIRRQTNASLAAADDGTTQSRC
jgi:hypothetical protein